MEKNQYNCLSAAPKPRYLAQNKSRLGLVPLMKQQFEYNMKNL